MGWSDSRSCRAFCGAPPPGGGGAELVFFIRSGLRSLWLAREMPDFVAFLPLTDTNHPNATTLRCSA